MNPHDKALTTHSNRWIITGHSLFLAGLILLLLWPFHPLLIARFYNLRGERVLSRAQRAADLSSEARLDRIVQAGHLFHSALTWDPLYARAYGNLATVYLSWQDTAAARRLLARAVAMAPHQSDLRVRWQQLQEQDAQPAEGNQP
jgi:hypothetical protein